MTIPETCPKCGAFKQPRMDYAIGYQCGTYIQMMPKVYISETCYERKIEQQAAEIERLREALKNIADAGGTTDDESGLSHNGGWCGEQARTALEVK